MSVLFLLIAVGGAIAAGFLAAFGWAVTTGQFDDTSSPPLRLLTEDADTSARAFSTKDAPHAPTRD